METAENRFGHIPTTEAAKRATRARRPRPVPACDTYLGRGRTRGSRAGTGHRAPSRRDVGANSLGDTTMSDFSTALPCRRPELVARTFGEKNGSYLIRDRLKGESFQLGPEEHFLLARLDGTRTAEELCAGFAERFGDPLTQEELHNFLDLARERGFLQSDGAGAPVPLRANAFPDDSGQPDPVPGGGAGFPRLAARRKRLAVWLLRAAAAVLQWLANHLI